MIKNLSQTLNRALIKRVDLLPNVSEFITQRIGIHEYAAVYGIEKTLRNIKVHKLVKGQPNRYLERQAVRLTKYAYYDQVDEYNKLSELIQRKSIAFRVLALNRTIDNWYTMSIKKLDKIWRSLSYIARSNSSALRYKRVWIDKKPGDYARPLGVPTPEWRCWSYMKMDHLERFYKASGRLASWQHGGRSGVGVLSCYKQLIPKMLSENTIYEFDIKGFFDNISHESIINRIKETLGIKVSEWVSQILIAKPMKYELPSEQDDKAYQQYLKQSKPSVKNLSIFEREWKVTETHGLASVKIDYLKQLSGIPVDVNYEDLTDYMKEFYAIKLKMDTLQKHNIRIRPNKDGGELLIPISGNATDLIAYIEETRAQTVGQEMLRRPRQEIEPLERELTRDRWKNLGQPGKGVPQGLGTSPFLSTFLTDSYLFKLKDNLIMYMDDGILFARNKAEMEKIINILKDGLQCLGLELAPEKSRYIKINGEWQDSCKFLGLRFLPKENTIMSDTRSGTQVRFPMNANWDDVKTLTVLNNSSVSNIKYKYDKLINTMAYEAGLKHGFLGCLIAGSQYKDNKTLDERRDDIKIGQREAWNKIQESKGFVWKFQDLHHYPEYLTNITSIQVHKFMQLNRKGGKLYHYQGRRHRKELIK
jgi:retron-type reverse transcriptase